MEAKLDMRLYDIINLSTAASNESSYAANVNYVNKTVGDNNATINSLIDSKVAKVEALNTKQVKGRMSFLLSWMMICLKKMMMTLPK